MGQLLRLAGPHDPDEGPAGIAQPAAELVELVGVHGVDGPVGSKDDRARGLPVQPLHCCLRARAAAAEEAHAGGLVGRRQAAVVEVEGRQGWADRLGAPRRLNVLCFQWLEVSERVDEDVGGVSEELELTDGHLEVLRVELRRHHEGRQVLRC